MINRNDELIRISSKQANKIEYSTNEERSWMTRYLGSSARDFHTLPTMVKKF